MSVVVPVYNAQAYLDAAIRSIIAQTMFSEMECILVDDGSTDGSLEVCRRYAQQYPNIKVIHAENGGVSRARNLGKQLAQGEYICFCDADDTMQPQFCAYLYRLVTTHHADMAVCGYQMVQGKTVKDLFGNGKEVVWSREEACADYANAPEGPNYWYSPWNKMIKREMQQDLAFSEQIQIGEDRLFVVQALMKCERVVFAGVCLYQYYQRIGSATGSNFSPRFMTLLNADREIGKLISAAYPEHRERLEIKMLQDAVTVLYILESSGERQVHQEEEGRLLQIIRGYSFGQVMRSRRPAPFGVEARFLLQFFLAKTNLPGWNMLAHSWRVTKRKIQSRQNRR